MTMYTLYSILHVIGSAIGVGAVTTSDALFLRAVRGRLIASSQLELIRAASHVVVFGLTIVTLTGIALVVLNPAIVTATKFQAKMAMVIVLILNGFVFHLAVFPYLRQHRDAPLRGKAVSTTRRWQLARAGAFSLVSWYGALVLGALDAAQVTLGLPALLAIYAALLIAATIGAYLVLSHFVLSPAAVPDDEEVERAKATEHTGNPWDIVGLAALLILLVGSLTFVSIRQGAGATASAAPPAPAQLADR